MGSRKAQVTLFIIIGILILITFSFALYTAQQTTQVQTPELLREETPVLFQPIRNFVFDCISSTAEEGIRLLGKHGGYLTFNAGARAGENPTESPGVRFDPDNENSAIPYWHYFKSPNRCTTNCECGSQTPNLKGENSIQSRITDYVQEELPSCLNNFQVFRDQGFNIIQNRDIKVTTNIGDNDVGANDVTIIVDYSFESQKEGQKQEFNQFIVRIPVNLDRIYRLAQDIVESQKEFNILEEWVSSTVGSFSLGVDRNSLPPISASVIDPGASEVTWQKSEVKHDIQFNVLPMYTQLLQVYATNNYQDRGDNPLQQALFLIENEETAPNYDTFFYYRDTWPIYFDIDGRGVSGETIAPETAFSGIFSFLGVLKRYNYYYDISFPVVIQIKDNTAFNTRGYDFLFAIESNIRNNKEIVCGGTERFLDVAPQGTQLCEPNKRCADITIETTSTRNEPIDNVAISFGTPNEQCSIGTSEAGALEGQLPELAGGTLSLTHPDYLDFKKRITVLCDIDLSADICHNPDVLCSDEVFEAQLEPYRKVKFSLQKTGHVKVAGAWEFTEPTDLDRFEFGILNLRPIKSDPSDPDINPIHSNFTPNRPELSEILIAPGEYEVDIDLYYSLPNDDRTEIVFHEKEFGPRGDRVTVDAYEITEDFHIGGSITTATFDAACLDRHEADGTPMEFGVIASPNTFDNLNINDQIASVGRKEEFSISQHTAVFVPCS